jgi:transcription termination factor Rho
VFWLSVVATSIVTRVLNGNISTGGIDQDKLIVPVNIIGAGNGPDCAHNGGALVIVNRYAGIGAAIVRIAA